MSRETSYLKLHLPDENEFYDVEKDQNKNFEKIDSKLKEINDNKEPVIVKKTGFNLNKTDEFNVDDTNMLGTAKALKRLYDELKRKIETLDLCPYKVGDVYVTTNNLDPSMIWQGTKWERINGRFLKGTELNELAGNLGGSNTKILSLANLPPHSHGITINAAGNHSHTQVPHSHTQPAHSHSISVELVAESGYKLTQSVSNGNSEREANLTWHTNTAGGENTGGAQPAIHTSGNHTHTATISNSGSGTAFDIRPAYYTVNMWLRKK